MNTLMNPERVVIVRVLKKAGVALPYSQIAKEANLLPEVTLAHLDLLVKENLVETHWGLPSVTRKGTSERCFELTDKVEQAVKEIDKLVEPLRV